MAICRQILRGQDITCQAFGRKYFQQLVLVNRGDVSEVAYDVGPNNHAIAFNLVEDATGYRYRGNENVSNYSASFSKSEQRGQPLYTHSVSMPVLGVSVETKLILKELDLADYFAAIQFIDGTVEIYGFENGLTTGDYDYSAQNGLGGIVLSLSSRYPEDDPPFNYGGPGSDFDDLFADIPALLGGDFNDDFSNDFYIVQL